MSKTRLYDVSVMVLATVQVEARNEEEARQFGSMAASTGDIEVYDVQVQDVELVDDEDEEDEED